MLARIIFPFTCLFLLLDIFCPRAALAYRPFDSTDAAVAAAGEMEIELGPLGYLAEDGARFLVAPELRLNWGVAPGREVVLEGRNFLPLNREAGEPRDRIEETALSVKSVLRQGELQTQSGASVATEVGLLLPTVHGEPGTGASAALILSRRLGSLTLHLNAAAELTRSHRAGFFGGMILEGPSGWKVRPAGEIVAVGERDSPSERSALVGAIWSAREGLAFDCAFRIARSDDLSTHEVRAGLTWDFPRTPTPG